MVTLTSVLPEPEPLASIQPESPEDVAILGPALRALAQRCELRIIPRWFGARIQALLWLEAALTVPQPPEPKACPFHIYLRTDCDLCQATMSAGDVVEIEREQREAASEADERARERMVLP